MEVLSAAVMIAAVPVPQMTKASRDLAMKEGQTIPNERLEMVANTVMVEIMMEQ